MALTERRFGFLVTDERAAEIDAQLADPTVQYVGGGRTSKLHLISGERKNSKSGSTTGDCGQPVSNKRRPATQREIDAKEICQKCLKGQRTSFSTYNQPRTCNCCGKRFADNAGRDNTDRTCPKCYEEAGYINAHSDGYHNADAEGPQADCPDCQ